MKNQKKTARPEVKRMKQGMSYSGKEKTIILNVFKYFCSQHPELCVTEVVRRTAQATGCSEKSIFNFRKEEIRPEGFKEPSKTKIRKNININSRFVKYDETTRQKIKSVLYELKNKNKEFPSLSTIRKTINSNDDLPNFSLMTLRRLLFDMGFYYRKSGNKSVLLEKISEEVNHEISSEKLIKDDNSKENKAQVPKSVLDNKVTNYKDDSRNFKNIPEKSKEEEYQFPPQIPLSVIHERQNSIARSSNTLFQQSSKDHNISNHSSSVHHPHPHMLMPIFSQRMHPPYGIPSGIHSAVSGGNVYGNPHYAKHEGSSVYHHGQQHHNML